MQVATRQKPLGVEQVRWCASSCFGNPGKWTRLGQCPRLHVRVWVKDLGVETFGAIGIEDMTYR
jgi:hypothetical protein